MPDVARGSVLGFDYGRKRIGIAVGDLEVGLAHPLETLRSEENAIRFARIGELVRQWQPVLAVVGLPTHDDGRPHDLAPDCLRFGRRLKEKFGMPVVWMDERYSSAAASLSLDETGVHGRQQKVMLDQVAAQHILQQYFDGSEQAHELA